VPDVNRPVVGPELARTIPGGAEAWVSRVPSVRSTSRRRIDRDRRAAPASRAVCAGRSSSRGRATC